MTCTLHLEQIHPIDQETDTLISTNAQLYVEYYTKTLRAAPSHHADSQMRSDATGETCSSRTSDRMWRASSSQLPVDSKASWVRAQSASPRSVTRVWRWQRPPPHTHTCSHHASWRPLRLLVPECPVLVSNLFDLCRRELRSLPLLQANAREI